ncbi:MAG: amidohydrolase [Oligoflexia bacterium]|nr:MAG: amidohydrolase [Oligoflexia bacterium]
MFFQIPRCYDSHVHLLGTGLAQEGLELSSLSSIADLKNLKVEKQHFRGSWLVGFGWDQHKWVPSQLPRKEDLDHFFPDVPVYFTRADGHAAWVNSQALSLIQIPDADPVGGKIIRSVSGEPTGVFIDTAMFLFEALLPTYSSEQSLHFLKSGVRIFNQAGFTHIRDMSGNELQWKLLCEMDRQRELTLYIDQTFSVEKENEFDHTLAVALLAKKNETSHLRSQGIKFYMDGALGSEGAWLSQNYVGRNHNGFSVWSVEQAEEIIRRTWENHLQVAIHCIGDLAAEKIVDICLKLKERNIHGVLNIEHAEVMRAETIQRLSTLNSRCHIQPCHWLSDRLWLKEKLGSLYNSVFPWAQLQKYKIPIQWGSDSPIEKASVFANQRALAESTQAGIPAYTGNWFDPHSHSDQTWGGQCLSTFENGKVKEVIFDGKPL